MKNQWLSIIFVASTLICTNSVASEYKRVDHHKGKMPHSLEEAKTLFSEYNSKLAGILDKKDLSANELAKIHQLTYTLENALGKIQTDLTSLSVTLESLHKASETAKIAETKTLGTKYLETSRKLVN